MGAEISVVPAEISTILVSVFIVTVWFIGFEGVPKSRFGLPKFWSL
jgi:hypothetical protein